MAERIQSALLAAHDIVEYWNRFGGTTVEVGEKENLVARMSGLMRCEECGTAALGTPRCNGKYVAHKVRAPYNAKGEKKSEEAYQIYIPHIPHKELLVCDAICKCGEPLYLDGKIRKHGFHGEEYCKDRPGSLAEVDEQSPVPRGVKLMFRPWGTELKERFAPIGTCSKCGKPDYGAEGSTVRYHVATTDQRCE